MEQCPSETVLSARDQLKCKFNDFSCFLTFRKKSTLKVYTDMPLTKFNFGRLFTVVHA